MKRFKFSSIRVQFKLWALLVVVTLVAIALAVFPVFSQRDEPDGIVTNVFWNPQGLVFLNIGSLDDVRPNQTFLVYAPDVAHFEQDGHKGVVTVTRIVGDHEARGLIQAEDPRILPGDVVVRVDMKGE